MVPQKVLDTELKKSFAHFNEGRIPVSVCGASWGLLGGVGFYRPGRGPVQSRTRVLCCVAALVLETPLGQRSAEDGQFSEQHLPRERRHQVGVAA